MIPMLGAYRTLLPYLKRHGRSYALGLSCLVAVDSAQLLLPQYLRQAVDSIAAGGSGRAVLAVGLSMVVTAAFIAAGRFLWRYFIHGASRRIETALRDRLFARLMTLPMDYFSGNAAGDIMARATNDMQSIRMAVGMAFVAFVDGVFMSLAILAVMFVQNPRTSLAVVAPLPLLSVLIIVFGAMVGKRFKRMQELYSGLSSVAQETLQGIRVVQSFVKEEEFSRRFSDSNEAYKAASMSLVRIHGLFFPLIAFLAGLSTLALVLAGGTAVIENRMTPGALAAMLAYLEMLIWPMLGAGFMVNMMQRGAASMGRVDEVLSAEPEPRYAPGVQPFEGAPSGAVELRGLSVRFPSSSAPALDGVSLSLPRGGTLGVLGRVGSGKSVLCKALARIVEPPTGTALWGGVDVGAYPIERLRQALGFVPQDSFLFSDSIRANVLFSDPDLPEARFKEAVAIAALDRDLRLFADGWETVVGERGLTLSGGQKQRVAIARAVARDPELLILDDALSAVDTETEEAIIEALLADRRGKTTILVSNRVSTLARADIVAVLEAGRLAQLGSPDELSRQEGFFAEIAALQALSESPSERTGS